MTDAWTVIRFLHIGLHVVALTSQSLSLGVLVASLLVVWLGVVLAH
jgi:hypothetical protein